MTARKLLLTFALVLCVVGGVLGYRGLTHHARLSALNQRLAPIVASNRRYLAMSDRIEKTADDLHAQFVAAISMDGVPQGNASAAASILSSRLGRLAGHVRDVDGVVAAARQIADRQDVARIKSDTTIALYRRIRVSELVTAFQSMMDDARSNPFAALGSARDVGSQLGHASYRLVKSLRTIKDDLDAGTVRQAATTKPIRAEIARLKREGPFSL